MDIQILDINTNKSDSGEKKNNIWMLDIYLHTKMAVKLLLILIVAISGIARVGSDG